MENTLQGVCHNGIWPQFLWPCLTNQEGQGFVEFQVEGWTVANILFTSSDYIIVHHDSLRVAKSAYN